MSSSIPQRVDIDFYNDVQSYLSELSNSNIKTIEDVIAYGRDNAGTMGAYPVSLPFSPFSLLLNVCIGPCSRFSNRAGWPGELCLCVSLSMAQVERDAECFFSGGAMNDTYLQTNARVIRYAREEGIDAALMFNGTKVDALLAPSAGSTTTPAAAAGYPLINIPVGINPSNIPYGIVSHSASCWTQVNALPGRHGICFLRARSDPGWLSNR